MLFIFGKLVAIMLRPFYWILGLLLMAWFDKKESRRRRWVKLALAVTLIMANNGLFYRVARWWESPPSAPQGTYDVAIVLGGFMSESGQLAPAPEELSERADRLLAPLRLYQEGKVKKILLSGGSGDLLHDRPAEALVARQYLLGMGIPDSVLILESRSINTAQNAAFSAQKIERLYPQGARCLLVTSAWHIPRALLHFKRAGLAVSPYPVDYLQSRLAPGWLERLSPSVKTLSNWELILKEWVGYLAAYR